MFYQWRYMFKWFLLALAVISLATCMLGMIFYLPSITDGPISLDYLVRGKCYLQDITYIEQKCLVDETGFVNPYTLRWEDCRLIQLEMISGDDFNFTWIFPKSFENLIEAEIEVTRRYNIGENINCVTDNIHKICYPEGDEIKEIVLITVVPLVLGIIFLGTFIYLQKYRKDWVFGE